VSSGFGEYAKPKTLNELIPLSIAVAKRQLPYQNGKHILGNQNVERSEIPLMREMAALEFIPLFQRQIFPWYQK